MADALAGGVEIGAVILAAAVLIAFVLMRPIAAAPKRLCYFDHKVVLDGDATIGDHPCSGDPAYRYVYLARGETGINVPHIEVCEAHIVACQEFVKALQNTVQVADAGA